MDRRLVYFRPTKVLNALNALRNGVPENMSVYLKNNVFVAIKQLESDNAPRPLPLSSGFSEGFAYEVLGIHTASESAEAFLILRNDRDEMWFISNRHLRIVDVPHLSIN